jgi:hypothetical protein
MLALTDRTGNTPRDGAFNAGKLGKFDNFRLYTPYTPPYTPRYTPPQIQLYTLYGILGKRHFPRFAV